jgi:PKHD-type hydroxylase
MILTLNNLLDHKQLQQLQGLLNNAPWGNGKVSAGAQAMAVKNNQHLDERSEVAQACQRLILDALDDQPSLFAWALPKRVFQPQFNRYTADTNHYGTHVDTAIRYPRFAKTPQSVIRADISCTVFLSDPTSYEGGELQIEAGQLSPEAQRFKGATGSVVLYPAHTLHQVTPVTRGERIACFFWIESMVRDPVQRQLLFNMDQSIQSLRSQHGETTELVQLTGSYHHLLRLWASV